MAQQSVLDFAQQQRGFFGDEARQKNARGTARLVRKTFSGGYLGAATQRILERGPVMAWRNRLGCPDMFLSRGLLRVLASGMSSQSVAATLWGLIGKSSGFVGLGYPLM